MRARSAPLPRSISSIDTSDSENERKNEKKTYGENSRAGFSRLLHLCAYKI